MRVRSVVAGAVVALAGLVTGCSGDPAAAPGATVVWSAVPLPAGVEPVTLTAYGSDLLVGTRTTTDPGAPGLLLRRDGQWTTLPVLPTSGYAQQATWLSIEPEADGSLVAVGGARGGAHANVRWTVWRGRPGEGLTEQVQGFTVFGGWGAGDQLAVLVTSVGPMLLGSWQSDAAGLDAAIWQPEGPRWVRRPSSGTALASRADLLVGARSGVGAGAGALVVGSVIPLGEGGVAQTPAVWMSERGNAGWARTDLPSAGVIGEAVSARCSGTCIVAGWVGERLALWRLEGPRAARLGEAVVDLPASYRTPIPAPALRDGRAVVLVGEGDTGGLLREGESGWDRQPGPPGTARQFALVGGSGYAVTTTDDGAATLWAARW